MEYVAVSNLFSTIASLEEALRIESILGLGRIVRKVAFFCVSIFLVDVGVIISTVRTS